MNQSPVISGTMPFLIHSMNCSIHPPHPLLWMRRPEGAKKASYPKVHHGGMGKVLNCFSTKSPDCDILEKNALRSIF